MALSEVKKLILDKIDHYHLIQNLQLITQERKLFSSATNMIVCL